EPDAGGRTYAKGGGPARSRTRKKPVWFCKVTGEGATPCTSRALCPHKDSRGRPKGAPTELWTFELTSGFYEFIIKSQELQKAGKTTKNIGLRDFLQFWLEVRRGHLFSGEPSTPAGL